MHGLYDFKTEDDVRTIYSTDADDHSAGYLKIVPPLAECLSQKMSFKAELATDQAYRAGLWLTANNKDWHLTDGMYERFVEGSTTWSEFSCVLEIPKDAMYVSYGLWLFGRGSASIKNVVFEVAESSTLVTVSTFYDRVGPSKWVMRSTNI